MKNRNLLTRCIAALLIFTNSCSIKVHTVHDPSINFEKYRTFCWLSGCEFQVTGPGYLKDSTIRERVKQSLVQVLKEKGLSYDSESPELLVDFHITMEPEEAFVYHSQYDDNLQYAPSIPQPQKINLLKGTLMIHMADKATSTVVWQSQAEGYMEPDPDLSEENIRKGISQVLKKFPPKFSATEH